MSGRTRSAFAAVVATFSLAVVVAPAMAGPPNTASLVKICTAANGTPIVDASGVTCVSPSSSGVDALRNVCEQAYGGSFGVTFPFPSWRCSLPLS
jgi:hypothetical protein